MKIQLYQTDLSWENPKENLAKFDQLIQGCSNDADLIILPEMFTTGFTMRAEGLAEDMDGTAVKWMKEMARIKSAAVTGSVIIKEEGKFYNRLLTVFPDGTLHYYNKKHLFSLAGEDRFFSPGDKHGVYTWRGWQICPQICYDLRFPEWARAAHPYQLLVYVASWPDRRIDAWDALLKARAIENQSYVAAVNRIGNDGNHINHSGHSVVYAPDGTRLAFAENKEVVLEETLDKDQLQNLRKSLPFLKDRSAITFD